eukprot:gene2233-gene2456
MLIRTWSLQNFQGLNTGCHSQWVARQGTSLIHGASWSNQLHDLLSASVRTDWKSSTNNFAHRRYIWGNSKIFLSATVGNTETRHNLVK